MVFTAAAKGNTQKTLTIVGMFPQIDTSDSFGYKLPRRFFLGFTNDGFNQAFIGIEMTGRLVYYLLTQNKFFNH